MSMLMEPSDKIVFCPCGSQIVQTGKDYFVCRACWVAAPVFFKQKLNSDSDFKRQQARNQITLVARRRGLRKDERDRNSLQ